MGRLLLEGVAPGGSLDLSVMSEVLGATSTWRATGRSLLTAAGGTVLSLLVGTAFALLVALTDLRAKSALVFCFMIPLMIPPQITALSWIQLFGPSSALLKALGLAPALGTPHPLYSPEGIMLLLGIQHAPLVFLAGEGTELYRGVGSVVLGGLLVSTLFTLFLVPCLFSLTLEFTQGGPRSPWRRPGSTRQTAEVPVGVG